MFGLATERRHLLRLPRPDQRYLQEARAGNSKEPAPFWPDAAARVASRAEGSVRPARKFEQQCVGRDGQLATGGDAEIG